MVSQFAYDLLTTLAAGPGAAWLAMRPGYRPLLRRFAPGVPATLERAPIWLQACSMGEVNAARPILEAMAARWPAIPLLLTTSTLTGRRQAEMTAGAVPVTWFPFDHRICVGRFLDRIGPRMLVLLETEVWPNAVRMTRRRGVPVAILNGRISDKHFGRYARMKSFWRPVFGALSAVCAQNAHYADRLRVLGVPESALHVTGNTKFEGVQTEFSQDEAERLRAQAGIPPHAPVLVFGSMRDGDERLASTCWAELSARLPELRMILVPRHLERVSTVCAAFTEPVLLHSALRSGQKPSGERLLVVDVMGELVKFYALATAAVIGGSFYPGVEGHNPLEPAALGIPTVFGPFMRNFIDPARALLESGGAVQTDAVELPEILSRLLIDEDWRARLASNGRAAVRTTQGAIARSLDVLEGLMEPPIRAV
ncbi:MAG TPA: glycosyltransferase N-terminal domain-containing protein [Candidatus Hydrogenedentes bacterium]|jgi:3-deoxy-D-manno-octulosonic-acid transferase|nr:glycosyltransferase N-terminal domain-containing protein [Candidatus Hydrogenedentota bacterium]